MNKITTQDIIESIKSMTTMELVGLVKELTLIFDLPTNNTADATTASKPVEEEQSEFSVQMTAVGDNRVSIIKALRKEIKGMGLQDAREKIDAVSTSPLVLASDVSKEEANRIKQAFEEAGATVEFK